MANAHNMMVRGLNAIYLQAPHIQPKDEKDFCTFITHWQKLITTHHRGEEELAFPKIEAMSGVKGLMDRNLEQHHAFHDGLAAMGTFATEVISGKTKYDGAKLIGIIDDFGPIVVQHLADEIPTISNLREYGDEKMGGLPKMMEEEGAKATVSTAPYINLFVFIFSFAPLLRPTVCLPIYLREREMLTVVPAVQKDLGFAVLCSCFAMLDIHYEDDLWINWPAIPGPIKFLCRQILWRLWGNVLKFGAVDNTGTMKPLYAVPQES